jgi:PiT family inorganic phosphate transporter
MTPLVIFTILVALAFDFLNGMHDAANSVATVVSTRVLPPKYAVIWAAFFNFVAIFIFGFHVALMIGRGIIDPTIVDNYLILSALFGAIVWEYLTLVIGIPVSASHSLIGGLIGAALIKHGVSVLVLSGIFKVVLFIFLSPLLGLVLGRMSMIAVYWIFRRVNPSKVDRYFRVLQLVSAGAYSLGHGANDAQKTMGIIAVLLFSAGALGDNFHIPYWVAFLCYLMMALGTLLGGWKIIKTMGMRVTKLLPVHGFCAESAGALTLFGASLAGIPVSTTHTITGSIIGVGSTKRMSAVKWGVARNILWAWILTIPFAALTAAILHGLILAFVK